MGVVLRKLFLLLRKTQEKLASFFYPFHQLEEKAQNQKNYRDVGLGMYNVERLPYILDFMFYEIEKSPYS